jgi:N-glycosylase/DNA lyase
MPKRAKQATKAELRNLHAKVEKRIAARLEEFAAIGRNASDEQLFAELAFCLFTPQSKAKSCWTAVCRLVDEDIILCVVPKKLSSRMEGVRFHHNKGRYVTEAQRLFTKRGALRVRESISRFDDPRDLREWLVENVRGMGHKEASHFLRNIGSGANLAILDRHILRNMVALGAMKGMPKSITPNAYLALEKDFLALAKRLRIPPDHLDMLLWNKEAGEVFK